MRYFLLAVAACVICMEAVAQSSDEAKRTNESHGIAPFRSEFVSYETREDAVARDRENVESYLPLGAMQVLTDGTRMIYRTSFAVPGLWLDREIFFRAGGRVGRFELFVNDQYVGAHLDGRTPTEFALSPYVHEGMNTLTAVVSPELPGGELEAMLTDDLEQLRSGSYLYSQPRVRIFDYAVQAVPDSTGKDGMLAIDVVVANSYNTDETAVIGFDIYDPAGKLKKYDLKEVTVPAQSLDTVRFRMTVYSAGRWYWSAAKPNLYASMLYVKYGGHLIEYLPFRVGFVSTAFTDDGSIRVNGKEEEIVAVHYEPKSQAATERTMRELKQRGVNTLYVPYPQPKWFYDQTDKIGFYVVDQANVNADPKGGDRGVHGTVVNDPRWLGPVVQRTQNMYYLQRNRPSVVAWSLGAPSGNGYDLYKSYQWLKGADTIRPVVYPGAEGEWNSDLDLPEAPGAAEAIERYPVVRRR